MKTTTSINNFRLPVETRIGAVTLRVRDLVESERFYRDTIGLTVIERSADTVGLGAPGDHNAFLRLLGDPQAPLKPSRTIGLYHLAIRFPHRHDLAHALRRLVNHHWPLEGAAHHRVSEALYLSDPEGNGVELYTDLPRSEWRWQNGQVQMATESLNLQALLQSAGGDEAVPTTAAAGTDLGHIHLHVADLAQAEHFLKDVLGFDVTQRSYPGALFFSAGGYHHHIAANVWAGNATPPAGSTGLVEYGIEVPSAEWIRILRDRQQQMGMEVTPSGGDTLTFQDMNGTIVTLQPSRAYGHSR